MPQLGGVSLGASHPTVIALEAALATRDPRANAAIDILALGVVGAVHRLEGNTEKPSHETAAGLL